MSWKLVYYGGGLGGKTENLVTLQRSVSGSKLTSYATMTDRKLRLELPLPDVGGGTFDVELHTEPG